MNEDSMKESDELLANLSQCREMCLEGVAYSLDQGGDFAKPNHINWMLDCAEICSVASSYYLRDSEYAGDILNLCGFICDECAQSCETFFNDKMMVDCAKVCRNCAEACRNMVITEKENPEE